MCWSVSAVGGCSPGTWGTLPQSPALFLLLAPQSSDCVYLQGCSSKSLKSNFEARCISTVSSTVAGLAGIAVSSFQEQCTMPTALAVSADWKVSSVSLSAVQSAHSGPLAKPSTPIQQQRLWPQPERGPGLPCVIFRVTQWQPLLLLLVQDVISG